MVCHPWAAGFPLPPLTHCEGRLRGNDGTGFVGIHGRLREIARIVPDTRPAGYAKIRSRRIFPEVVSARKPLRGNGR